MNLSNLINNLQNALNNNIVLDSKIYDIYGLTSPTSQNFLNVISKDMNVLEIGSFCGASTIPIALSAKKVYTVDNWQNIEINPVNDIFQKNIINPKKTFFENTKKYDNIVSLDGDIFSKTIFKQISNINTINNIDVIFYDGSHTMYDIITFIKLYEFLLENCILIIDDYNFLSVKDGIKIGLNNIKKTPIKTHIIETKKESKKTFWNGVGIYVFK